MKWYDKPKCLLPLKVSTKYHTCIEFVPSPIIERNESCTRIIKYRSYTNDKLSDFAFLVEKFNWKPFYESSCIDFKVRYMNTVLNNAFEVSFKEKEKTVRTTDNLWVTESLSELFRKNKKYSKKSVESVKLKKLLAKHVKEAKENYNKTIQTRILSKVESLHSVANRTCNFKSKISPVEKIALSEQLSVSETLNKIIR